MSFDDVERDSVYRLEARPKRIPRLSAERVDSQRCARYRYFRAATWNRGTGRWRNTVISMTLRLRRAAFQLNRRGRNSFRRGDVRRGFSPSTGIGREPRRPFY